MLGIIIIATKKIYESGALQLYAFIATLLVLGALIGYWAVSKISYNNWHLIKPFISTNSVKKRIEEINTKKLMD